MRHQSLSGKHLDILQGRGLDASLLVKLGVVSTNTLAGDCIAIPYFDNGEIVNWKYRTITGEKMFSQDKDARKVFWNVGSLRDESLLEQPVVITEGEFDAMIALQCGFGRVLSVPDGAPAQTVTDPDSRKYSYIAEALPLLTKSPSIVLAVDADGPGQNLRHDLEVRLGRHRCRWVKYPEGSKDLNDVFMQHGQAGVVAVINSARWCKVDGVYRMSELPDSPYQQPMRLDMDVLDDHYRPRLGDFTVITGIPGHGKSSLITDIQCRMIAHGWPQASASFEQDPKRDHRRNLRSWIVGKREIDMTESEMRRADVWIDKWFTFIVPGVDDDVTLEWLLEKMGAAVVQNGVKMLSIDPWNEMDHVRPSDMSLTEYTGYAIKKFKAFARSHNIHLIVAAHPAKQRKTDAGIYSVPTLYDISDSAHWYNKADVGIIIHRDEFGTLIRVAKSRYHDEIGKPGDVRAHFMPYQSRFEIEAPEMRK